MDEQQATIAIVKAAEGIAESHFSASPDGWPDQIGMALIDAVYSIQARYHVMDETKSIPYKARIFRENYPDAAVDLSSLQNLGEGPIRAIMGNTKSAGRYKSDCIIEAVENFLLLEQPVRTAADIDPLNPAHKLAYTSVKGLGWVTYEYFTMLLGKPGVKADTMICRFVNTALAKEGLASVDARTARRLVESAHVAAYSHIELHHFDHAIWLHQRALPAQSSE